MTSTQGGSVYGDAVARRRAVLDSAVEILDEGGYPALTNRAVAKRAGMSPGLIYQYFVDKQDIFITLLQEAETELSEFIEALPRDGGVAGLLAAIVPEATRQWKRVGHLASTWQTVDGSGMERKSVRELRACSDRQFAALHRALVESADTEGRTLHDGPAMVLYVWAGLTGIADTLTNKWLRGGAREDLVAYSTAALARSILELPEMHS
ncbi:TetR/AcrR family transcriptional regulator [Tomitella cavernea]|uniref:HTH tetR-type domain-containing protein n=1 Tax=Tomitella cavernea TaxID=1387982 RepID=A0ABP9C279_9ACTN|nr:TetR/AcrR family transcriptional regulator [Tomitella cavernea]